jgi:hypothetical protein
MSTVRELHDRAAELAQQALIARQKGERERAEKLAREAYGYEAQAAELVPDDSASEPTRSILYLSAASLAYQCKEFQAAQRFVAKGLSGYPPPKVEQELKDLFEQLDFERHLQERGIVLEDKDLQISMRGASVGSGMVLYDAFDKVIQNTMRLVNRTVERKMGRKFRTGRGRPRGIYRQLIPALGGARAGSFAITLRLGVDESQASFMVDAPQVIDDILIGIELVDLGNEEGLEDLIGDDVVDARVYRQNFVNLVRDMAPDGDRISSLGFTSKSRSVGLTRLRDDIRLISLAELEATSLEVEPIEMIGTLDFAKSRSRKDIIEINPEDGSPQQVFVEDGLIDVVTSYFLRNVKVRGKRIRDEKGDERVYLEEIWPADT